jgi:asparagine synthase (glutamine-hydrolysing)
MCGILGIVSQKRFGEIDPQRMLALIAHRGPDDEGCYSNDHVFLGHRRLSILDLSGNGHQPMYSLDKKYVIIFNGEIYNHLDIRSGLAKKYHFRSTSDTETLLYGYIEYGTGILNMLNGMFAFAIYNIENGEIFIARDQCGIKPLYYYQHNGIFAFGSEMKSFLSLPEFDRSISLPAICDYLTFLWSPGERTPFQKVLKLLPGHYLKFNTQETFDLLPVKYYEIPYGRKYEGLGEQDWVDLLDEKLTNAVKRQLLSDVPVGFFLSGGLDSSLLVAIARKQMPDDPIKAFTIDTLELGETEGFADDLHYAKLVARHLKADLDIVRSEIDIVNDFDRMIWHLDEPQADAAPLNVYNICTKARTAGYKVLIGGTGGDDLFSGYRRHQALKMERYFQKIPPYIGRILKSVSGVLPVGNPKFRRLRKLLNDVDKSSLKRRIGYFHWLPESVKMSLFSGTSRKALEGYSPDSYFMNLLDNIPEEKSLLNQMLYWEQRSFLVDHNLNYTDKLSMATGVEVRVPYLDMELVELAAMIPPHLKLKSGETKYILKKVAERYLPAEVIYRPKTGFGAPVRKWITQDLDDKLNDYLSAGAIKQRKIFDPHAVSQLIANNKAASIDASYPIWALLAFESWMRQFVDETCIVEYC